MDIRNFFGPKGGAVKGSQEKKKPVAVVRLFLSGESGRVLMGVGDLG